MGTTRDTTKSRILDGARKLIAQNGYAAVSMRDIAETVGIRKSSIYNHFPAKQDILTKLMIDHLERAISLAEKSLEDIEDPVAKLQAFARFHITHHVDYLDDVFLAYMELRSLEPGEGRDKILSLRKNYEDLLRDILEQGVADGLFAIDDVFVHGRAILAMLTGVTAWFKPGLGLSKDAAADLYVKAVLHGVFPEGAR